MALLYRFFCGGTIRYIAKICVPFLAVLTITFMENALSLTRNTFWITINPRENHA
jgi:hypothetical protein